MDKIEIDKNSTNIAFIDKKNDKVPLSILSCFLIAFIIQGILKLRGILVFEKVLEWEIFDVIDKNQIVSTFYYTLIMVVPIYCLSFSLTSKPYSNKWYHYAIIILISLAFTLLRTNAVLSYKTQIILDIVAYIIVPVFINITTAKNETLLNKDIFGIIVMVTIHIGLYFCYLGLTYWSGLLNTLVFVNPVFLSTSRHFLLFFEIYIGIVCSMLSLNILTKKTKKEN